MTSEKDQLEEKHKTLTEDNAMLLAKVEELQTIMPELEVKNDTLTENSTALQARIDALDNDKLEIQKAHTELIAERDRLLARCEEFTQKIYEYDVEKITSAGKMDELQRTLEVFGGDYFLLSNSDSHCKLKLIDMPCIVCEAFINHHSHHHIVVRQRRYLLNS